MSEQGRHYVNPAPFDPHRIETMTPEQERFYQASSWRIMWWKFRRHRLALISVIFLAILYASTLVSEAIAPYGRDTKNTDMLYAPPQSVHLFHDGSFVGPFVYGLETTLDMDTFQRVFAETDEVQPLRFFCLGDGYKFWGLLQGRFHVICPAEGGSFHWFGTDRLGRDLFSRMVYGARLSLTIGVIGVAISYFLGIIIGGLAGYYGGVTDTIVQRLIEIFRSFPELPLWMALAAIIPVTWNPVWVFIGITVILGLLDWPGLARAVRSKFLSLREEDFCTAAQLMGASPKRIIFRHLLPSFSSHIIASASLSIPSMILGETALSFLGIGLRPPLVSWGVMLNEVQDFTVISQYPWQIIVVVPVVLVVLAFNLMGDGLRDAADPYK